MPSPAYLFPGAVGVLTAGDVEEYPDDQLSRSYHRGFSRGLNEECGTFDNMARSIALSGLGPLEAMADYAQNSISGIPTAAEGVSDAQQYAAAHGCGDASTVSARLQALGMRRGSQCAAPADRRLLISLMSDAARMAVGVGSDGLFPEEKLVIDGLTPGVEQHLRSRQMGSLDDQAFRAVSRSIAVTFAPQ